MHDLLTSMLSLEYEGRPVRIVWRDGEPWWVANDVCDILDLGNARQALTRLPKDEKGVTTSDTLGENRTY